MDTIKLKIYEQRIVVENGAKSVTGTVGVLKCQFEFDPTWEVYTTKSAIFRNGTTSVTKSIINNQCDVPPEVLTTKGDVEIALMGANTTPETQRTDTVTIIDLRTTLQRGKNAMPITPDQYTQFVEEVAEDADRAEAAKTSAETASTLAREAAVEAAGYRDEVAHNAQVASSAATTATNAAGTASSAATSAHESALSASSSATTAGNQAATATEKATAAAGSASSASTSASAASTSATNAGNSATAAANSATAAGTSATNAANSASAAGTSATNASNSASAASSSASAAAASAEEIEDLTVSCETLPEGSEAEAVKTKEEGEPYNIHFKIPKGDTGDLTDFFSIVDGMLCVTFEEEV